MELERISITIEPELLRRFEGLLERRQLGNRSEAIRDLIRKAFVKEEWLSDKPVMGVISLVYDHHQHKLQEKVTLVQHDYHHQIISTTHVHMDHDNCLEIVAVRGRPREVNTLVQRLKAVKGLKHVSLAAATTGRGL